MELKEEKMSQIKKSIQWRAGVFVLLSLICVSTYVILLGNQQTIFSLTAKYKIQFKETHGLFRGSMVTVNGLPAGNVAEIQFIPQTGRIHVLVSIINKFSKSITDQSNASLETKGVLGDKFISIFSQGAEAGNPLPSGSFISSQSSSSLMNVLGGESVKTQLADIIKEVYVFTKNLNSENSLGKTSQALERFSTFFSKDKSKDFSDILKLLKNILIKIDRGEGTAGALINNRSLYNRISTLLGQKPYYKYLPALVEDKIK